MRLPYTFTIEAKYRFDDMSDSLFDCTAGETGFGAYCDTVPGSGKTMNIRVNGAHSTAWTADKVSDEEVRASYRAGEVTAEERIPALDFYREFSGRPDYWRGDGCYFKDRAYECISRAIVRELGILERGETP